MSTIGPIEKLLVNTDDSFVNKPRIFYSRQLVYKSRPRSQRDPLPYTRLKATSRVASIGEWSSPALDCLNNGPGAFVQDDRRIVGPARARCAQKAYGKLTEKVKKISSGWGETLATRKMAYSMMLHRIATLTNAARRLRKGDIRGFCRALSVTERGSRSKAKKAADTWLEYHFGWEPLLGDIYTACKISSADFPVGRVRASSQEEVFDMNMGVPDKFTPYRANRGRVSVLLQGEYTVENSDKLLLNQLGVINPVGLAWELVPFSFVIDWFIPIGQYLGAMTDFYGIKRDKEFTTLFVEAEGAFGYNRPPGGKVYLDAFGTAIREERTLGISVPKPTFKLYRGFSPARGATAIALLVGMLKSLR